MKILCKRILLLFSVFFLLILPMGCHGNEEENIYQHQISDNSQADDIDQAMEKTIVVEVEKPKPTEDRAMADIENAPVAAVIETAPGEIITPITAPMEFARSVFDNDLRVLPWHANYVGSYGILPTRVQDEGPFLYSYEISRDSDIFPDDDDDR